MAILEHFVVKSFSPVTLWGDATCFYLETLLLMKLIAQLRFVSLSHPAEKYSIVL